ncbi:hypothetical protein Tco_1034759, partial [Tanacetum coccineum]
LDVETLIAKLEDVEHEIDTLHANGEDRDQCRFRVSVIDEVRFFLLVFIVFPFRAFLHAFSSIVVSCLPPVSFLSTLACRLLLDDSCLPSLA